MSVLLLQVTEISGFQRRISENPILNLNRSSKHVHGWETLTRIKHTWPQLGCSCLQIGRYLDAGKSEENAPKESVGNAQYVVQLINCEFSTTIIPIARPELTCSSSRDSNWLADQAGAASHGNSWCRYFGQSVHLIARLAEYTSPRKLAYCMRC